MLDEIAYKFIIWSININGYVACIDCFEIVYNMCDIRLVIMCFSLIIWIYILLMDPKAHLNINFLV